MNKILLLHRSFWTIALAVMLIDGNLQPASVWAQANPSPDPTIEPLVFNSSPTDGFEDTGRPANQTSTGSRAPGSCSSRLVALVPGSEPLINQTQDCSEPDSLLALTVDELPTFWFYIPELETSAVSAEFVLVDNNQRPVYREQIALNGESGIVGVRPTQPLEVDRVHRWIFQIVLSGQPGQDPAVEGFVKRIQPDSTLTRQLAAATSPQERVRVYANHGIWHEALTELATLHLSSPNSAMQADWASLLESVGLGAIANFPLLNCCTSQPISN
ncbi:MAG: DUF928 domain-containing protein [Leptolyngbyaceae cyanobacterium RM2_2_4]|nr:DUF928 domain-containing protein [Leptolyngbyaceae cyanobacterium SM1_4_3]NJO50016.1 DUF928 domain-containing protein [Leptolyngbyaceae cyanobacterium RM2_2_4]